MALPAGTTIKFKPRVKRLMKQDAKREGHNNLSLIARRIIEQHYGLLPKLESGNGGR